MTNVYQDFLYRYRVFTLVRWLLLGIVLVVFATCAGKLPAP
jgi:hypothetical protein